MVKKQKGQTKALAKAEPDKSTTALAVSRDDINTLEVAGVIPKAVPEPVLAMFLRFIQETGLSPFKRQVHLIERAAKDGDKWTKRYTIQTGVDGYRTIAARTGAYAGNDDYAFDDHQSEFKVIETGRKRPITATATVYRIVSGQRVPFSATARWDEYFPGEKQGFMWNKMPFLMLGKCAESLALRKAFPEELGGLYTEEEMAQVDAVPALPEPKAVKPPKPPAKETPPTDVATPDPGKESPATEKELKGMFAVAKDVKLDMELLKKAIDKRYNITTSLDLTNKHIEELIGTEVTIGLIQRLKEGTVELDKITRYPAALPVPF
jgi:phage recombination protein Bet